MSAVTVLTVLATEGGLPYNSINARAAVPLGILIFLGLPYLLLRSNLGTRRAYLVLATSFFGFMIIMSLFWTFGAPGTPPLTGPTNLPGTMPDEYEPVWFPFAGDSLLAQEEPWASLLADEGAFGPVPQAPAAPVQGGIGDIRDFFSSEEGGEQVAVEDVIIGEPAYAVAETGEPVVRVTFGEEGAPAEEGFTAFAYFDAGNPLFPSLLFLGLSVAGFALHGLLLHRDEQAERRERTTQAPEERERVPVSA